MAEGERLTRGAIINELGVASRYAHELAFAGLREAGVEPDEYGWVSFVAVLQPVTRTKLTQATGQRRTTVRDAIRRMVERGHVEEVPHPRDGRSTLLRLTPSGRELFDTGLPVVERVLKAIDEALGGKLDEHEEAVWRVRLALQELAGDGEPAGIEATRV
jgi:DNA-binding MarR family transcriptional regulator